MQDAAREGSALRSPAAWARFLAVGAIGAVADLWTKHWAFATSAADAEALQNRLPLLDIATTKNYGAVWGIAQGQTHLFIAFTILALLLLGWLFAESRRGHAGLHLSLGAVVAGAVGNLYDRIALGHVRDFLRFNVTAGWAASEGNPDGLVWPPVFNIADVFISVGVVGLMLAWLVTAIIHWRRRHAETPEDA